MGKERDVCVSVNGGSVAARVALRSRLLPSACQTSSLPHSSGLPTQDLKTTLGLCMPYLSACRGDDRVGGRDDVKRLRAAVVKGARERRIVCRDSCKGGEEEQQHRDN